MIFSEQTLKGNGDKLVKEFLSTLSLNLRPLGIDIRDYSV